MTTRTYHGWAIFLYWKESGDMVPVFDTIYGQVPWFKTKKEAQAFLASVPKAKARNKLLWEIRRVRLEMHWD